MQCPAPRGEPETPFFLDLPGTQSRGAAVSRDPGKLAPLSVIGWKYIAGAPTQVRDWDRDLTLGCREFQFEQAPPALVDRAHGRRPVEEFFEHRVPKVIHADGAYYLVIAYDLFDRAPISRPWRASRFSVSSFDGGHQPHLLS